MDPDKIEELAELIEEYSVDNEHVKKIARQILELLEREEVSVHRAKFALALAYSSVSVYSKVSMDPKESYFCLNGKGWL